MNPGLAVPIRKAVVAFGFVVAALASAAAAQDLRYRDGRFLETVGGVTIQRADDSSADEAVLNMPFLPGDRVWTDDSGRAEIVFADGEILWIAERSKVDSLGRGGPEQDERLGLRIFAGSFGARVRSGGPGFEFRAPGGSVTTSGASAFRIDVRGGETVVSVSEGEVLADLAGERLTIRGGERVRYADRAIDGPYRFQRASADRFDRWCEERSAELDRMARDRAGDRLPGELGPYAEELDRNGEWVYEEPQGYVFVPRVAYDWAPYTYGRWVYTVYGWTWVASEPWGFVTSHYGRWGYSSRIGWHWMPRVGFSGAWVSWSSPLGSWGNTIGWCALGFNDRPVTAFARYGSGGRAVARGEGRSASSGPGWSFANRSDLGRADLHRRLVDVPAEEAQRAVVWSPNTAPDRDFRETRRGTEGRAGSGLAGGGGAVARGEGASRVYLRPSPGDSLPELRSDPATTIPSPESRRGRTIGQDGFKEEQDSRKSRARRDEPGFSSSSSVGSARGDSAQPRQRERTASEPQKSVPGDSARAEGGRERATRDPLLSRFFRSITRPDPDQEAARDRSLNRSDEGAARRRESPPREDPSARESSPRDQPRPVETRPADQDRARSRPSGVDRSQPRNAPPPQAPPRGSTSSDGRGAKRPPHKDH
jgi:hypothetical protein